MDQRMRIGMAVPFRGSATIVCSDIYGNAEGDWVGCIANQGGEDGNISQDPQFCNAEKSDFHLMNTSPCAPENNPDCGLVGAWSVGCGPTRVSQATWGQIKAGYR